MLKTVPFRTYSDEALLKYCPGQSIEDLRKIYNPQIIQEGVVQSNLNFDSLVDEYKIHLSKYFQLGYNNQVLESFFAEFGEEATIQSFSDFYDKHENVLGSYGVADSLEQILELYKLEDSDDFYTVEISPMYKKDQSETGGWRWHKWGPYIGTQKPTTEYLYDEPEIDLVYVYHIFKWKKK